VLRDEERVNDVDDAVAVDVAAEAALLRSENRRRREARKHYNHGYTAAPPRPTCAVHVSPCTAAPAVPHDQTVTISCPPQNIP